jgi:hypothetical protein
VTLSELHKLIDRVSVQGFYDGTTGSLLLRGIDAGQLSEIFLLAQSRLAELDNIKAFTVNPDDVHAPSS